MLQILFPKLSYEITGLCFKVHNTIGRFASEKQYGDALESLLKEKQIPYKREHEISNANFIGLDGNKVDFLIDNKVIVDLKAKKFVTKEDYNQIQRYLQASNLELGLIVNFRNTYIKPKRVLNVKMYSDNSDADSDYSDRPYQNGK